MSKIKVGNNTQIYCVTQDWVDGDDSEVFVMMCFLDKKDAIAFIEDTWEEILNDAGNKYNMTECSETMKAAWKGNKRAKHHVCLFIDTVTLK